MPGAPPWQPPPAFTAAAAGMQVWSASGQEPAPWPAATGEPVWSEPDEAPGRPGEPGDVAVWPPDALPGETDESTADVRGAMPGTPTMPGTPAVSATPAVSDRTVPAVSDRTGSPSPGTPVTPDEAGSRTPGASEEPGGAGSRAPGHAVPPGHAAPPERDGTPGHVAPPERGGPAWQGPASRQDPPIVPSPAAGPSVSGTAAFAAPAAFAAAGPPAPAASRPLPEAGPSSSATSAELPVADPAVQPGPQPTMPLEQPTRPWTAGPALPVPPPPPVDEATPPGGIPLFPPLPTAATRTDGPPTPVQGDPATERGPFTPLSAFTPEPPPPAPAPARSRASTVLLAAVVAVVVIGIGVGAFLTYRSFSTGQPTSAADPIPTPGEVETGDDMDITSEPEPVNTTVLNSEKTDPGTVTVADAFVKKVTVAGATFTRVKTDVAEQCQKAAAGRFADTLRGQDCRRVLRATYVDGKRRYAVTTGIAVLPTRESAIAADRAKNLENNLWFRGLPATAGSGAERVHIAGGYAAGMVWGRYIVFSYATFSDGHTPTAKEKTLAKVSGAFRDQTAKVVERRVTN
ncbi:hypothetical protein [Streptosporangium sp. NPDC023615]|uniref:hypothetical protein n=1 Tax=Streptosporangium sp. NPDC023615 TaxID=3154794 RepID=UPI00342FC140